MRRSTYAILALLGLFLLASLACGFGDFLADEAPETASIDEIPLPDQLATILLEMYDIDTALGAIFAALERGYSYPQLAGAIDDGTLQADGHVKAAGGELLAPAGLPAGVIDLSDLEASRHDLRRAKSPADTRELIVMEALIEQVKEQFQVETEEEMAQRIIDLYARGYTAAQITEAIMFDELQLGIGGFGESVCIFLMTADGEGVLPEADGYLDDVACTEGVDRLRQATADAAIAADTPATVQEMDEKAAEQEGGAGLPDSSAGSAPAEPEDEGGMDDAVPVGRYIGEQLDVPDDWILVESEFVIDIAEDGTVSGYRAYIIEKDTVGATCTTHQENGHYTFISGVLSGANGYVAIQNESYSIWDSSDCGGANRENTFEQVCEQANISIAEGRMEIFPISGEDHGECGFVFTAAKE